MPASTMKYCPVTCEHKVHSSLLLLVLHYYTTYLDKVNLFKKKKKVLGHERLY